MKKHLICLPMLLVTFATVLLFPPVFVRQAHAQANPAQPVQVREETPGEFVERNLASARKKLAAARLRYQQCCGLADLALDPIDPASILSSLPKPHQLKFIIRSPEKKIEDIKPVEQTPGKWTYYPGNLSFGNAQVFYDQRLAFHATVAADELSSSILRLPQNLFLGISGQVIGVNSESYPVKSCCLKYHIKTDDSGRYTGAECIQTAQEKYMATYDQADLRAWTSQTGFSLTSEGGEILGKGAAVRFKNPGYASVTASLPRRYDSKKFSPLKEQICQGLDYEHQTISQNPARYKVIEKYYNMKDRWGAAYKTEVTGDWEIPPAQGEQKQTMNVDVVAFRGVRLDGVNYSDSGKEAAGFDLFARGHEDFKPVKFAGKKAPELLLQRAAPLEAAKLDGSRPDFVETLEDLSRWPTSLNYYVEGGGPFQVSQQGDVQPMGGIGEARLRLELGQHWSLKRKITANRWQAVPDAALADGAVSPGGSYRVAIQVQGPADMSKYKMNWKGGTWKNPAAVFIKQGEAWQAENLVTIPANTKTGNVLELSVEAVVGDKGREDVRLGWSQKVKVVPRVESLELTLAAKGRSAGKHGLDLFFPNYLPDGNRFAVLPIYRDSSGNPMTQEDIKRFLPLANLRLLSDTPLVAMVGGNGGQVGRMAGEAWITAELGGIDLDPRGQFETAKHETLVSNPVKVTANQLLFSRGKPSGGFTPYALRVIGPADMNQYQALFHFEGGSTGTPFIHGADGSYLAGLSVAAPVKKVEILKEGKIVASMPVRDDVLLPQAGIRLMPVTVPDRVIDRIALTDMGSLTSTTECRKQLRTQYPGYYGHVSDNELDDVCDDIREAEKKEIKEQRAIQKDQQKIVKLLKKEGRQMIVFEDSAQLGAVVTGNFDTNRMYCRWRVDRGGSLKFENLQTPITKVGADGSCFNNLKGFQGNFDTEATATVELIYAHPAAAQGQFIPGGTEITRADVDAKQVEEWINN